MHQQISLQHFFLSLGPSLRSLNLVVGKEVQETETLFLAGFKWAWLACGWEKTNALANHVEILCIKHQQGPYNTAPSRLAHEYTYLS